MDTMCSGHLFVLWKRFFRAFTIANHLTMLHPSFCQHPNVLDLYNLGPERKITQTKLFVSFTTCHIFNLSCTSPFLSVTTILRGFVNFEWQEMAWAEQYMCPEFTVLFKSLLVKATPNAVVLIDILASFVPMTDDYIWRDGCFKLILYYLGWYTWEID